MGTASVWPSNPNRIRNLVDGGGDFLNAGHGILRDQVFAGREKRGLGEADG
ncbi:MAG TPA: hypothetical protein VKX49_08345 [Bryobacteraceae bacterium]|nr:hypothetical protein [Bryobacteraceae bacterium]